MDAFRWGREGMRVGEFTLLRGIATGGFGEVWLAESDLVADGLMGDGRTPRKKLRRALKLLMDDVIEEATRASAINHPNVVQIYSCGKVPGQPLWWVAMEFVDGYTLEQLRAWLPPGSPPPAVAVLEVAKGLMSGLVAVHEARDGEGRPLRLVHRDIKPSNVMINLFGEVKILDFGIAKELITSAHTLPSERRFTPRYAAPEQHLGEASSTGTDLFSWACVVYEFACGEPLFAGSSDLEYERQKAGGSGKERVRARWGSLCGLGELLLQCLERDPGSRPGSARDLYEAIDRLRAPLPARPRLEHLVRLRRDGLLPPDITGPLPADWADLARWAMQPPLPQSIDPHLLHGAVFDARAAAPITSHRLDKDGLAWPEGVGEAWRPPVEEPSVAPRPGVGPPAEPTLQRPPPRGSTEPSSSSEAADQGLNRVVGAGANAAASAPTLIVPTPGLTPAQERPSPPSASRGRSYVRGVLLLTLAILVSGLVAAGASRVIAWLEKQAPLQQSDPAAPQAQRVAAPTCSDADKDGYRSCSPRQAQHDCDDEDAQVHPGAEERCDGVDDDCDGSPRADEVVGTDGRRPCDASPPSPAEATSSAPSEVATTPSNPAPSPPSASTPSRPSTPPATSGGAKKPASTPTYTCLKDNDRDGYGSSEVLTSTSPTCTEEGMAPRGGDCHDGDASIHPDATEDCSDKVNSDCSAMDACITYSASVNVVDPGGLTKRRVEVELTLKPHVSCDGVSFEVRSAENDASTYRVALKATVGKVWTGQVNLASADSKAGAKLVYRALCQQGGSTFGLTLGDGYFSRTLTIP